MKQRFLCLLCALALLSAPALAEAPLNEAWANTSMTEEEMLAIYQESFDKMDTTGAVGIDLVEDLAAFEKEYKERTGLDRKEDMVLVTLPGPYDMPYDEALAYARQLIMDTFGTPESELDAMGVYPRFIDYVYMPNESEWEFYITPLTHANIDEGHTYDAPGEYRVHFGARSRQVELCNWYIDDFFPDYAQRTWDAGKRAYVFQRAQDAQFRTQSLEAQAHFLDLFRQAGYDVSSLTASEPFPRNVELGLMFLDPAQSLMDADDPAIRQALSVIEERYGLSRERLKRYSYIAVYSPLQSGDTDVCVVYNYEDEFRKYDTGELEYFTGRLYSYIRRLGSFMVKLDQQTLECKEVIRHTNEGLEKEGDPSTLLGHLDWTLSDADEYDALMARIRALVDAHPNGAELEGEVDALMREAGGDPKLYDALPESDAHIGKEAALAIAREAVTADTGLAPEALEAAYRQECDFYGGAYHVYLLKNDMDSGLEDQYLRIDANSGEVLEHSHPQGLG